MATRVVTIFGGSGFIGRHLVQRLARRGWLEKNDVLNTRSLRELRKLLKVTMA